MRPFTKFMLGLSILAAAPAASNAAPLDESACKQIIELGSKQYREARHRAWDCKKSWGICQDQARHDALMQALSSEDLELIRLFKNGYGSRGLILNILIKARTAAEKKVPGAHLNIHADETTGEVSVGLPLTGDRAADIKFAHEYYNRQLQLDTTAFLTDFDRHELASNPEKIIRSEREYLVKHQKVPKECFKKTSAKQKLARKSAPKAVASPRDVASSSYARLSPQECAVLVRHESKRYHDALNSRWDCGASWGICHDYKLGKKLLQALTPEDLQLIKTFQSGYGTKGLITDMLKARVPKLNYNVDERSRTISVFFGTLTGNLKADKRALDEHALGALDFWTTYALLNDTDSYYLAENPDLIVHSVEDYLTRHARVPQECFAKKQVTYFDDSATHGGSSKSVR